MKGFTLIELVVAVSISLFVTGIIIVNYNTYNSTQVLKQSALTLKNDLRFIQSKAANGEKPAAACTSLTGWTITFSANSYSYQPNCDGSVTGTPITVQLPSGLAFSPLPNPNAVTFRVLTHGTSLSTTLNVDLTGSGKVYTIAISASGDISDLGIR